MVNNCSTTLADIATDAKNYDITQPGEKNNDFLYDCYPNLTRRIKYCNMIMKYLKDLILF